MKQRVKEMEAEAAKLREMQAQAEKDMNMAEEGMYLDLSTNLQRMEYSTLSGEPTVVSFFILCRQGGC